MRSVFKVACLGVSLTVPLTSAADIWRPPPRPAGCVQPIVHVHMLDVSKSMKQFGNFIRAQRSAMSGISTTGSPCSLAVVAAFGMTARVIRAAFLTDAESRAALSAAVTDLVPDHDYTNLDESVKLIELLTYQLQEAYSPPPERFFVRVYTDNVSSPSRGNPIFSIADFLEERLTSDRRKVTVKMLPDGLDLRVAVPDISPRPARPRRGDWTSSALIVTLVLVVGLAAWVFARLRETVREGRNTTRRVSALCVTESVEHGGTSECIVSGRRVPVGVGVPAVFSTDSHSATYVASAVADFDGELFRIEPLADGNVRVKSRQPRITVNAEPLDFDYSRRLSLGEPIRISLGPRSFVVTGEFQTLTSASRGCGAFNAAAQQE